MVKLIATLAAFVAARKDDDRGATAVEYGLMVALIAAVIIAVVTLLGTDVEGAFQTIENGIGGDDT